MNGIGQAIGDREKSRTLLKGNKKKKVSEAGRRGAIMGVNQRGERVVLLLGGWQKAWEVMWKKEQVRRTLSAKPYIVLRGLREGERKREKAQICLIKRLHAVTIRRTFRTVKKTQPLGRAETERTYIRGEKDSHKGEVRLRTGNDVWHRQVVRESKQLRAWLNTKG